MSPYVKAVIDRIRDKNLRKSVQEELESHVLEKTEYYTEQGFPEEEAARKANDDMGSDPYSVGCDLENVHMNDAGILFNKITSVYAVASGGLLLPLIVFFGFALRRLGTGIVDYSPLFAIILPVSFFSLFLGIKTNRTLFCVSAAIDFSFPALLGMHTFLVLDPLEFFSGNAKNYHEFIRANKAFPQTWVLITADILIVLFVLLSLAAAFLAYRYNRQRFSGKMLKIKKGIKAAGAVFAAYTVFAAVIAFVNIGYTEKNFSSTVEWEFLTADTKEEAQRLIALYEDNTSHKDAGGDIFFEASPFSDTDGFDLYYAIYSRTLDPEKSFLHGKSGSAQEEKAAFDPFIYTLRYSLFLPVYPDSGYLVVIPRVERSIGKSLYNVRSTGLLWSTKEAVIVPLPLNEPYELDFSREGFACTLVLEAAETE